MLWEVLAKIFLFDIILIEKYKKKKRRKKREKFLKNKKHLEKLERSYHFSHVHDSRREFDRYGRNTLLCSTKMSDFARFSGCLVVVIRMIGIHSYDRSTNNLTKTAVPIPLSLSPYAKEKTNTKRTKICSKTPPLSAHWKDPSDHLKNLILKRVALNYLIVKRLMFRILIGTVSHGFRVGNAMNEKMINAP